MAAEDVVKVVEVVVVVVVEVDDTILKIKVLNI
jgi:hypothetical protein